MVRVLRGFLTGLVEFFASDLPLTLGVLAALAAAWAITRATASAAVGFPLAVVVGALLAADVALASRRSRSRP